MVTSDNNEQSNNQKIEEWNIIYDILIDEERYDEIKIGFESNSGELEDNITSILKCKNICKEIGNNKPVDGKSKEVFRIMEKQEFDRVFDSMKNVNPEKVFRALIRINNELTEKTPPLRLNEVNFRQTESTLIPLWCPLFIAKKARAVLKYTGSHKALKAVDGVAEYLLSKLPDLFKHFGENQNATDPEKLDQNKFLVLYYNEISQCYRGNLSIGFAEKALKKYGQGKCHYELLGLYNKAIGYSHIEEVNKRKEALGLLDEINVFDKKNLGYSYKIDEDLWKMYVYYPSLIEKADILSKLQRGKESIDALEQLLKSIGEKTLSKPTNCNKFKLEYGYKKIQAEILKAHALIETDQDDKKKEEKEKLVKELLKNLENKYLDGNFKVINRDIFNKHKVLRAKYIIEKVRNKNFEKPKDGEYKNE